MEWALEKKGHLEELEEIRRISTMVNIHYIRQPEPLGLGHAILCAKTFIGQEAFAVLLGDDVIYSPDPCTSQLIRAYEKYNSSIIGVQRVAKEDLVKYGNLKGEAVEDGVYRVEALVEKPQPQEIYSELAVLGRHILTPGIFKALEETSPGRDGEIQLTDALSALAQIEEMYAFEFQGRRYDLGSKQGFLEANIEYALRDEELRESLREYLRKTLTY